MTTSNRLLEAMKAGNAKAMSAAESTHSYSSSKNPLPSSCKTTPKLAKEKSISKSPCTNQTGWQHFSLTCSTAIVDKIHGIVEKEGFSLRQVVELFLQRGIDEYEKKHGTIENIERKIDNLI